MTVDSVMNSVAVITCVELSTMVVLIAFPCNVIGMIVEVKSVTVVTYEVVFVLKCVMGVGGSAGFIGC